MEQQMTLQTDNEVKTQTTKEWDGESRHTQGWMQIELENVAGLFHRRLHLAVAETNQNHKKSNNFTFLNC